jgi:uncharacterized protein YjbI with pentapeptide repeats
MQIQHKSRIANTERKIGLSQLTIAMLVILVLLVSTVIVYLSQILVEQSAFIITPPINVNTPKEQYEIAKLAAEIRQIRSDTGGSLFWLKMIALFVTVGGAIGGYLIGQSRSTRARIEFEDRKNVDTAYQAVVQELSDESALLRAAAVVKLGMILKSFPQEWNVNSIRREQLIDLTKQVLAASLSIEDDPKVRKTLTSAIALHRPWENDAGAGDKTRYGDLRSVDLSRAKACDAYWARVDFTYADFYRADLTEASFREAILHGAQFREAILKEAVFMKADCEGANFKFADLRHANLTDAILDKANFEGAKVHGVILTHAKFGDNPNVPVDNSPAGDKAMMIPCQEWLAMHSQLISIDGNASV